MNVLLVINNSRDVNFTVSSDVVKYLKSKDVNIYADDDVIINNLELLKLNENNLDIIDFSLIIGGDGTILKYASKYGKCKFPFIGINMGRVGALTLLEPNNYKEYVDRILAKDYHVVERMGLSCDVYYTKTKETISFVGYNDIILHRSSSLKLLPIMINVNDTNDDMFYADGIVVSTPSGSSAYNVSAGGPLLSHSSNCYVITPICPQSKSFTPLVVSENDVIKLALSDKSDIGEKEITISADGCYMYYVAPLDRVTIKKSDNGLKMIQFRENNSIYRAVYKAVASIEKRGEK